jgi:hypothetical protein
MRRMRRKQIYIDHDQDRRLGALARRRGESESHLIREGIDRLLNSPLPCFPDSEAWAQQRRFIDSLIRLGPVKGKRTWTREEIHER